MALPTGGYSYSPQTANLGASPLSALKALDVGVSVQFTPMPKYEVPSAQQELVSMGAAKGFQAFAEPIIKAFKDKEEERKAGIALTTKHEREKEIAEIKAEKTPEEKLYELYRTENLKSLIQDRGGNVEPKRILPSGVFQNTEKPKNKVVEPELPKAVDFSIGPDFIIPDGQSVSSLRDIPLPEPQKRLFSGFAMTPEGRQLQEPTAMVPPEMQTLLASSTAYGTPDVGGKDVLTAQTQASAMTPAVPQTPQQMSEFAKFAKQERELPTSYRRQWIEDVIAKEEAAMPAPMPEMASIRPDDLVSNAYESWQDAEQANKMLAKMLPDYDVNPIKQETVDGQTFYVIDPPTPKQISSTSVPEGLKIKSAKKDATGKITYDLEPELPKEKKIQILKQPIKTNDIMLKTIKQIKSIYEGASLSTGFTGTILQWIPASDAADVRKLVKTLQGNIAFKALADMRAASPTGGALGAVSERELELLASTLGSIDPNMSHFLFKQNLEDIEKILTDFNSAAKQEIQIIENPQKFTPIQSQENRVEIKSQEDYNKLKSGQKYIFNGVTGTKK